MNSLSWLLYLADVLGNMGQVAFALCFIFAFVSVIWVIFGGMAHHDEVITQKQYFTGCILFPCLFLLIMVVKVFIPSKDTVYAIAVSEVGEDVYKSKLGQKAEQALSTWLDKQIAPVK